MTARVIFGTSKLLYFGETANEDGWTAGEGDYAENMRDICQYDRLSALKNSRVIRHIVFLKPCPSHCRRKVRLSPKTARKRRQSPNSARQSHFSATVWTGLYSNVCDPRNLRVTQKNITKCMQYTVTRLSSDGRNFKMLYAKTRRRQRQRGAEIKSPKALMGDMWGGVWLIHTGIVSSPSGVRGVAAAENRFYAYLRSELCHLSATCFFVRYFVQSCLTGVHRVVRFDL